MRRLLVFILLLSASVGVLQAGEKITKRKIAEKLEFFKVSYPPFNYQAARKEAEEKIRLVKPGDKVTVHAGVRKVTGVFRGIEQGRIFIGNEVVLLRNVDKSDRYKFDKKLFEKQHRAYIESKFYAYTRKRQQDVDEYRQKLQEKYAVVDEKDIEPSAQTQIQMPAKAAVPRIAIIRKNILASSGAVKAGEVVRDVRRVGYDRFSFVTEDGRKMYTDTRNLYIFYNVNAVHDSFAFTQAALGLMLKKQDQDALYYAAFAARINENQKRSPAIVKLIKGMNVATLFIKQANAKIARMNKEITHQLRLLARNQNALQDNFSVKAGTRDRKSTFVGKAVILREKRKHIQLEEKEKISALAELCEGEVKKSAAAGDFIAACLFCDLVNKKIAVLRERATVRWDKDENEQFELYKSSLQEFIVAEYNRKISRPFKDRWREFLDRYVERYGYNETELQKLDLKPTYNNLLAAAGSSIADTRKFADAVAQKSFGKVFDYGMKILVLMPRAEAAENVRKAIATGFSRIKDLIALVEKFSQKKLYGRILKVTNDMDPLPLALKKIVTAAKLGINNSNAALSKAQNAAEAKKFDLVISEIRTALECWPGNVVAQKFYSDFMNEHKDVMRDSATLSHYLSQGRFKDAYEKCNLMFKEYPSYGVYVRSLRKRIKNAIELFSQEMIQADNYFKAGRLEDARKIYAKYNKFSKVEMVYTQMLKTAQASQDWGKVVAILEKLGRWEEAGKLRKEHNLSQ